MSDFIKLYNAAGYEIPASKSELICIEKMDMALFSKKVGYHSGRYWLISNRKGHDAVLLEFTVLFKEDGTSASTQVSFIGIGGNGFTFEKVIEIYSRPMPTERHGELPGMHPRVAAIAREYVVWNTDHT